MAKRVLIGAAVLLLVVSASAFGFLKVQSDRSVVLPTPTGPDRVGRVVYDWVDQSRMDPFAPDRSTPRELSVWVWYPAAPTPGVRAAAYWPSAWQRALGGTGGFSDLLHTRPASIQAHALEDPPVSTSQRQYPVLVLAPGQSLMAADYTTIAEDLASHGYVVAGINPTYSIDVVLSSDRVVRSVAKARDADYGEVARVWGDDMTFVAGQMGVINTAPTGPFSGRLETARIGFFGHSAGGAAAVQGCHHDDLCPAAADLDGLLGGDVLQSGLGKPFLYFGSEASLTTTAGARAQVHSALQGVAPDQGHVLTVAGTGHYNFTDHGVYFSPLDSPFLGSIDGARALRVSSRYVRAFFTTYQSGRADALLAGPAASYPEVHTESL